MLWFCCKCNLILDCFIDWYIISVMLLFCCTSAFFILPTVSIHWIVSRHWHYLWAKCQVSHLILISMFNWIGVSCVHQIIWGKIGWQLQIHCKSPEATEPSESLFKSVDVDMLVALTAYSTVKVSCEQKLVILEQSMNLTR